ncbi:MAG: hypothetical protein HC908_05090 [Calothrix sp. SM1_7_51]|nr:hypothetical protein [Calothrix sp. SM1_7_51]
MYLKLADYQKAIADYNQVIS